MSKVNTFIRLLKEGKISLIFQTLLSKFHSNEKTNIWKNNTLVDNSLYSNIHFSIEGSNNHIEIDSETVIPKMDVVIKGDNHKLKIGSNCNIKKALLWFEDTECEIILGDKTTIEEAHIAVTEPGRKIEIGEDCMLSHGVSVRSGDSHSIIDMETNQRINYAKNVFIGNHCWIGANATILKGVTILDGAIVGAGSIVTKDFPSNCIVAGNPARVIKKNVSWDRKRI